MSVDVVAEEQMAEIKELFRNVAEHIREGKQTELLFTKTLSSEQTNEETQVTKEFLPLRN